MIIGAATDRESKDLRRFLPYMKKRAAALPAPGNNLVLLEGKKNRTRPLARSNGGLVESPAGGMVSQADTKGSHEGVRSFVIVR